MAGSPLGEEGGALLGPVGSKFQSRCCLQCFLTTGVHKTFYLCLLQYLGYKYFKIPCTMDFVSLIINGVPIPYLKKKKKTWKNTKFTKIKVKIKSIQNKLVLINIVETIKRRYFPIALLANPGSSGK